MRVLWRYLLPYRKTLIILIIFGVVNAGSESFVPYIAGKIVDALIAIAHNTQSSVYSVLLLVALWGVLQSISNIITWRTTYENDRLSTFLGAEYVANAFGKLFELPLAFHTAQKQGDLGDRISRASNWMDNIVGNVLLSLIPNFITIIAALIITFMISRILPFVLLAAIGVYAIILWRAMPGMAGLQHKMNKAYNRAYGYAYDALGNIKEIKQAVTEREEQEKIRKKFVSRAAQFWVEMNAILQRLTFSQRLLVTLTQLTLFVISVFLVRNGSLTPGELVAFNGYAAMIFGPFIVLGQNWQTIQNGMVAITRAEDVIARMPEEYEPEGAVTLTALRGEVVFHSVHFTYEHGKEILSGVTFHVQPGQKIALVGESGAGKTTIIDLLSGFYFPDRGSISVDGTDIRQLNLNAYRARIGVVPQEPTLFNDTVGANIRYGNTGKSEADMLRAAAEAHADEFIAAFPKQYKQIVGWRGIKLSIGQKQRIALARAFLRDPDILILDEPTSALDAKSEHFIKQSLEKLMEGRTTFIIAHRLSTVRTADCILVLKDGTIVEQGTHNELMARADGEYRMLYDLQVGFTA